LRFVRAASTTQTVPPSLHDALPISLFMPTGTTVDKLLRALVGVTLFSSAYLAETVRGGLQALPRGQYEAAAALGLGYWKRTWFIDRKSTRLNSSHVKSSYAVFCLKK